MKSAGDPPVQWGILHRRPERRSPAPSRFCGRARGRPRRSCGLFRRARHLSGIPGVVIELLDLRRKMVRHHGADPVFAAVPDGLSIVPAFEIDHGQRPLQPADLSLHHPALMLEQGLPLGIGPAALTAPLHEPPDVPDLQAGLLQALNDPEGLQLRLTEPADAGGTFHVGEQSLLVIVAEGGDGDAEHLRYLTNRKHVQNLPKKHLT